MDIPSEWKRFVIEAVRGGDTRDDDEGDICIDDFAMSVGRCKSEFMLWLYIFYVSFALH